MIGPWNSTKAGYGLWSGLPQDIVQLILEKLDLVDRIQFHAVCKDWLVASIRFNEDEPIYKGLPWIVDFQFSTSERVCLLFEPFYREPYIMECRSMRDIDLTAIEDLRSLVYACRCGWVLISGGRQLLLWRNSVVSYYVGVVICVYGSCSCRVVSMYGSCQHSLTQTQLIYYSC